MATALAVMGILCTGFVWVNGMPPGLDWVSSEFSRPQLAVGGLANCEAVSVMPTPDDLAGHLATDEDNSTIETPPSGWLDTTPSPALSPIQTWGTDLSSERLLAGLSPWPSNPPVPEDQPPLSSLGRLADEVYKFGPLTLPDYARQLLEFVDTSLPTQLASAARSEIETYLRSSLDEDGLGGAVLSKWDGVKRIWQTDKDESMSDDFNVKSWRGDVVRNEGWKWELVSDTYV